MRESFLSTRERTEHEGCAHTQDKTCACGREREDRGGLLPSLTDECRGHCGLLLPIQCKQNTRRPSVLFLIFYDATSR